MKSSIKIEQFSSFYLPIDSRNLILIQKPLTRVKISTRNLDRSIMMNFQQMSLLVRSCISQFFEKKA